MRFFRKVQKFFTLIDPDAEPEVRLFVISWQRRHSQFFLTNMFVIAVGLSSSAFVLTWLLAPEPARSLSCATYAAIFLIAWTWRLLSRWVDIDGRYVLLMMQSVFALGLGMAGIKTLNFNQDLMELLIFPLMLSMITIFNIVLYPWWNAGVLIVAAGHLSMISGLLLTMEDTKFIDLFLIVLFGVGFSLVVFFDRSRRLCRESVAEYESRKLLLTNEQLKREAVERDLVLAREIHHSFEANQQFEHGRYKVRLFQKTSRILGGDWVSSRTMANGDLSLLVVDATGKGVAAALVVHAVQSLWAYSHDDQNFDPMDWIRGVNRTLMAMGQRATQSVSLGLVLMGPKRLRYYAAGHPPLFLVYGQGSEAKVSTLMARGDILGLQESLEIHPVEVDLEKNPPQAILMGTDGVFPRGGLTRRRDLQKILERVAQGDPSRIFDDEADSDDRMLIVMQRAA